MSSRASSGYTGSARDPYSQSIPPTPISTTLGETRVDLVHLLEDLRDAYPGSLEETILTEVVANALDSGARTLTFVPDPDCATLAAIDDGSGMSKQQISRYHDLATTSKRRGKGIGFAGVGIKLGLLACDHVVTETRRGRQHVATSWRLTSRSRAPWQWTEPPHLVEDRGTAISLRLSNPLSQLLDPGFIEATILRQFQPLFEPEFLDILEPSYPEGLTIVIRERAIVGPIRTGDRVPLTLRLGRQRKPSAVGYLARHDAPLPEQDRGLAISTLGKVIRRGWDWLGISPGDGDRIEGLIEVPALAEALTLNKGDFLRTGPRGALFLSYRKAIQEAVAGVLSEWGEQPEERRSPSRTKPIERDLDRVLDELAADYPLLTTLAERRSGGQKRLPLGDASRAGEGPWGGDLALGAGSAGAVEGGREDEPTSAPTLGQTNGQKPSKGASSPRPEDLRGADDVHVPGPSKKRRHARLALQLRFESLPGDDRLGRLIESTVWVNDAHPAYRRAVASRAEGYHLAVTVASALAPHTVEPEQMQDFVNAFLARWGEAAQGKRLPPARSSARPPDKASQATLKL